MGQSKKKAKNENEISPNDAARKIALVILKIQQYFSNYMNKLFKRMSNRKIKVVMILFCLTAGSYSTYLILNAGNHPLKAVNVFTMDPIKASKQILEAGDVSVPNTFVDEASILKIQEFMIFMDSLQQNNIHQYDSILQARPGLMDSVQVLKEIYYSQK